MMANGHPGVWDYSWCQFLAYLDLLDERLNTDKAERLNSSILATHDPKTAFRQLREWLQQ